MSDARNPESICADCSMPNPTWASLNRGVLVCDDCCGVHRSLGRHISYIKSLHSSNWSPAVREMVSSLVRKGANSIWEHALHDSSSSKVKIRKPSSRDKVHPTKHDFIVAKYKHLSLLPRMSVKEAANMVEDLSKQLHASVRTSNLETCLRLLSMGADPNYLHPDRGNTPLHVAAHANQAMQVELLVIYGANPSALDLLGHTPEECARIAGHHQLADRLIESQYELTDRLSFFLCGRKPVHSSGEHYLIPQGAELNDVGSEAKSKLQQLSNEVFEELAADIYDEVDRRETDSIWLTTLLLQDSVAFLPVNPAISPMRNQGRQKLGTLDGKEFSQLVTDVLLDTKRRQNLSLETGQRSGNVVPTAGGLCPEHDYDDVAMEEEARKDEDVQLRKRSKLTPPVESTYSIIGGEERGILYETNDERYSHLHVGRPNSQGGGGGQEGGGEGEENHVGYSLLSSPDHLPSKSVSADSNYSTVSDVDKPPPGVKSLRRDVPPLLPVRPKTTYDRIKSRPSMSSPSPVQGDEETVSRTKFDIIMDQLRKVQKEKEELELRNEQLCDQVNELQKQLNKVITENADLRNSATPEPTSPKTPSSPVDSPPSQLPDTPSKSSVLLPPPPPTNSSSEQQQEGVYSAVNKKKPKPPFKAPLAKTWSTPAYRKNPTSPLPHATTPPLQKSVATSSPQKKTSSVSIDSTSPIHEVKQTINEEDSLFIEDDEATQEDSEEQVLPPPVPRHQGGNTNLCNKPPSPASGKPPKPSKPAEVSAIPSTHLPPVEEVHQEIKSITMCIQELLKAAQTQKRNEFEPCSLRITGAVGTLVAMFPSSSMSPGVDDAVRKLLAASSHLKNECQNSTQQDQAHHTRLIMNGAYDVAKAARVLVTCVESAQK